MKPDQWRMVEELYQHASDLPHAEQQAFLLQACGTDQPLFREVESLLRQGTKSQSVLDTPAITALARDIAFDGCPSAPLSEGQTFSHYRILKSIGQGGMGIVYAAEDTKLRRRVALKLLPMFMARNREALQRFEREAQAASALNHPNICTVYEIDEAEGLHFIAIELLEGETVKDRIARGRVEAPEILAVGDEICNALESAHSTGIVHRDIKPSNIFITRHGTAKLLDFGVAKRVSSELVSSTKEALTPSGGCEDLRLTTTANGAVGTIAYMSPEQASGTDLDSRSDLFSLGAVLYEMTTGGCPFPGKGLAEVIHAIQTVNPVPVEHFNPKASPELVRIIKKALQKDPSRRYQCAREMGADLKTLRGRLQNRTGKRRRLWVLASAIAALAVMVSVFFGVRIRKSMLDKSSLTAPPHIKTIAVLPLANLTGDPLREYFVDGMTDALIMNLTKLSSLRVISRTSAMHYKGTHKTIPEIARELSVDAVLEGSVVVSDNRVRVSAQLADAVTGQNFWGHDYEQDLQDVLQMQSQVAAAVATELAGKLNLEDLKRLHTQRTVNPEVYEAYLRGRHFLKQGDPRKSLEYFQEAIRIDPNYAPAYSGLADVYVALGVSTEDDADKSYALALQAATKAISLDDSLAEAHASLAFVLHRFKQDWQGAEKEYKRALELDPNYAVGQKRYGVYLLTIGRTKAGCNQIRLAHSLDPISPDSVEWFARCLYENGHFNEAVQTLTVAIEMNPKDEAVLRQNIGEIYERSKMYPEAVAEYQKALKLQGRSWMGLAFLASGYASWGKSEDAERVLAEIRKKFGDDNYVDAGTHAAMGRKEQAIRELVGDGKCTPGDSSPGLSWLRINWRFDIIRSDPRYKALERCANYPDPE